jgi:DUF2934 family protein
VGCSTHLIEKASTYGDFEEEVMVAKRESPVKKIRRKAVASELTDSAVMAVLESTESRAAVPTAIDPEARRQLVAAEAYFLAERRGFAAGNEVQDWVAAEAAVDARLKRKRVA